MLGKDWTGSFCRYFRENVLPLDPVLEKAVCEEEPPQEPGAHEEETLIPRQGRYDLDLPKARDSKGS